MADERPLPAPLEDGAAQPTPAEPAASAVAPDAISPDEVAELTAVMATRRSLAEGLRDVLALPALGRLTKRCTIAELQDPEHLLKLLRRWHQRTPTLADVASVCLIATLFQCGRQTVVAYRELADRLDGPVTQRLALSITPEQAERMSDVELGDALKRAGLLTAGAVH
jgi:hypothetical protein